MIKRLLIMRNFYFELKFGQCFDKILFGFFYKKIVLKIVVFKTLVFYIIPWFLDVCLTHYFIFFILY